MTDTSNSMTKVRNLIIAGVAIALSLTLILASQTKVNSQSLEAQAEKAIPLEMAITNGKPTLMEFYANWCTSCQAMAGDLAQLKQEFDGKINFVMLNVDNSKWLPEILNYGVDGIPHFVFLNQTGDAMAETIGEQPLSIFEENLTALLNNQPLPYANSRGNISAFNPDDNLQSGNQDNPRDHR